MSQTTHNDDSPVSEPQRLLLSVLSSLPDTAVVVVDPALVVRFVRGPVLERRGWEPEHVLGRPVADVLGEQFALYAPSYRTALGGQTATLEAADGPDGAIYRTEFLPLRRADHVVGVVAVVRDVTDQVHARTALERSEREFRLLAENATDLITRHDLDGAFRYVSPSVTSLLGWAPAELVGRSSLQLIHPGDQEATTTALAALAADTRALTVRYRMAHRDGSWVWFETVARRVPSADGDDDEIHASQRDVTAQIAAERAEHDAQELFRLAFDHAPIGMALVGLDGTFTRVNAALCDLLERPAHDLLARTFQELTDPEDLLADLDLLRRLTAGEIPHYQMEKRYLAPDGGRIWAQLSVSLLRDAEGRPQGYVSQVQDIGERKRMQDALQHLADHDVLSGLWNRRRFEEELRREISRARRHGPSVALLLFDLDSLKRVNDTFGHAAGDELIRAVAGAVRVRLRDTDALARIGGDEFAVLLAGADIDAALLVGRKLCTAVRDLVIDFGGEELRTTTSIGVTLVGGDAASAEELLAAADRAMYVAKTRGGDRVAADD